MWCHAIVCLFALSALQAYQTYPAETMWLESMDAMNASISACHFVTVCVGHLGLVGKVPLHLIHDEGHVPREWICSVIYLA
jgi:hypothetical protein